MVEAQNAKYCEVIRPAAIVDNASHTSQVIATEGYDYLEIVYQLGATDIAITALSLEECATSGGSYAAISSSAQSPLPTATDDFKLFVWHVDLRKRQKFIKVVSTMGDGSAGGFVAATARLSRARIAPVTATEHGLAGLVTL